MLKYFTAGFLTKLVTGFDDTFTQLPLITYVTKTRMGKIAFATGIFLAICFAIVVSITFASVIKAIPYYRYFVAGLIFLLALLILFGVLGEKRVKKTEKRIEKVKKKKRISNKRFLKLVLIGFIAAFATVLDDIIVYSSLFLNQNVDKLSAVSGIISATFLELFVIIYFSKKIRNLKHRKEIITVGLFSLGLLVLFEVI